MNKSALVGTVFGVTIATVAATFAGYSYISNEDDSVVACVFHAKAAGDSTANRPPIPRETGH